MPSEREVRELSIDPERRLPGEELSTENAGDAAHWIDVYSELLNTKRQLIANLREMMERQPQDVQDELERADVRMLQMQVQRFENRRGAWQARLTELEVAGESDAK